MIFVSEAADMSVTYSYLEIFSAIVILVLFFTGLFGKKKINKALLGLVISFVGLLLIDATLYSLIGKPEFLKAIKLFWVLFYMALMSCLVCFHEYVLTFIEQKKKWKRIIYFYAEFIATVYIILWAISLKTNLFYSFDSNGNYEYTNLRIILDIAFVLVLASDFFLIIKYRKKFGKRNTIAFLSYGLLPLLTEPLSIFIGTTIISILATAISIILIYVVTSLETEAMLVRKEAEIVEKNKDLADKQFKLIYSQIQPHFLYNVLNTIYYLVDEDVEKGKKAIVDFSDYMRMNLDSLNKPMLVDFEDELKKTEIYLSLEKLRFEDELNIKFDVDVKNFKVPQLMLQPLIENAVKHGICKKKGGGTVTIYTRDYEQYYEIGVVDDGVGFDMNKPLSTDKSHIGLSNIIYRIKNMCNGTVDVDSTIGVGTKVVIKIPKEDD